MSQRSVLLTYGLPVVAATALTFSVVNLAKTQPTFERTEPSQLPPAVEDRGSYLVSTGIIEPASEEIALASQVPGVVRQVLVKAGDTVKAGDPLIVVDNRKAEADVLAAQEDLHVAEAGLAKLKAETKLLEARVTAAEASLSQTNAELDETKEYLKRAERIALKGSLSDDEMTKKRFTVLASQAKVNEAESRLAEAQTALSLYRQDDKTPGATILVQHAMVERAKANLAQATVTRDWHTIRAPRDATVLQVRIRPGEFASAAALNSPMMILGVIDPLHVRVDIDEVELGRFQPSLQAACSLRGQPQTKAPLKFVRVEPLVIPKRSLTGTITERVDTRVMQVLYQLDAKALPAKPGQQVDVFLKITDAKTE